MHEAHEFLRNLALVLCAAAVTTIVFQRLRLPVVLGYLLAGMVIGPHIPVPLVADNQLIQTMAELGVVLLMFSLGIEFSLPKLLRVGSTAAFVAVVQCSLMIWLGYLTAHAMGWSWLQSLYAGGVISISSTTIIVKAFGEQRVRGDFTQLVFGVLIVEDLIAILLITVLTALSIGDEFSLVDFGRTAGQLAMFLTLLLIVGLLVVPRAMRYVVGLNRNETTVVASVGLAFGFALLAAAFGYSVALGAFLAGSLVAESGVEKTVERVVQPVRDIFAAIFFVSVGMLIDPDEIVANWPAVLAFTAAVLGGMIGSVTFGALLTGQSVQTSIKMGMSLAQIGEFSFIIAGVGLATGVTDKVLYSIAVAVSGITTLFTPWLIRAAEPTAAYVDRKLPHSLQTFVALYGSWLEQLKAEAGEVKTARIRRLIRWLAVDAIVIAAIMIVASVQMERISAWAQSRVDAPGNLVKWLIFAAATALSAPFWIGLVRMAGHLGFELACRVFPRCEGERLDLAASPRRVFVVTLQLAIFILVGFPLVAVTQPFLPPLQAAVVLLLLIVVLAISFWRGTANFQGHTRAAAQAIVEAIAEQTRLGREQGIQPATTTVSRLITGLGSPVTVPLRSESPVVGQTLAEINLRGLTGATVLAIQRGTETISVPAGSETLLAGDTLAIAGPHDAIEAARKMLASGPAAVMA